MAEATDTDYLSIGEVLGLLLEEFPDVTISKIRFLESQGLIDPERTPSGYRKFYEPDVELLRVILREQRENYLPLRVIKDRLETGAIDPSGELPKPEGDRNGGDTADDVPDDTSSAIGSAGTGTSTGTTGDATADGAPTANGRDHRSEHGHGVDGRDHRHGVDEGDHTGDIGPVEVPASAVAGHPAAARGAAAADTPAATATTNAGGPGDAEEASHDDHTPVSPQLLPGVVLDREELCGLVGVSATQLAELERFGIVTGRGTGPGTVFGEDAVEIAKLAVQFLRAGVDARHLRGWRTAAEREASLYEQLVTPRLRQRNPESRAEALDSLRRLDELGAKLRSAMVRTALRHHFEG